MILARLISYPTTFPAEAFAPKISWIPKAISQIVLVKTSARKATGLILDGHILLPDSCCSPLGHCPVITYSNGITTSVREGWRLEHGMMVLAPHYVPSDFTPPAFRRSSFTHSTLMMVSNFGRPWSFSAARMHTESKKVHEWWPSPIDPETEVPIPKIPTSGLLGGILYDDGGRVAGICSQEGPDGYIAMESAEDLLDFLKQTFPELVRNL